MTRGDQMIEKGSERLRELSRKAAERGGVAEKLAQPLAEDADFLRKLKPSLVAARARGAAPTDEEPGEAPVTLPAAQVEEPGVAPVAPPAPQVEEPGVTPVAPPAAQVEAPVAPPAPRVRRAKRKGKGGPNPLVVLGVALALGFLAAKVIDWRSHAHPRH